MDPNLCIDTLHDFREAVVAGSLILGVWLLIANVLEAFPRKPPEEE